MDPMARVVVHDRRFWTHHIDLRPDDDGEYRVEQWKVEVISELAGFPDDARFRALELLGEQGPRAREILKALFMLGGPAAVGSFLGMPEDDPNMKLWRERAARK